MDQLAVQDLKAIGAPFSQLITATMISRLVLNLRASSSGLAPGQHPLSTPAAPIRFMERTIGNSGEDLDTILDHDSESSRATGGTDDSFPLVDIGKLVAYDHCYLLPRASRG